MSQHGPEVWDGWQPGDPLPPEIQATVDSCVADLRKAFFHDDGSPVIANEPRRGPGDGREAEDG